MDIIVLGNGFDLAHGLPTKYVDFLNFINIVKYKIEKGYLEDEETEKKKMNEHIVDSIKECLKPPKDEILKKIKELIEDNFWIKYFENNKTRVKENWIDFESEMSYVIQGIDEEIKTKTSDPAPDPARLPLDLSIDSNIEYRTYKFASIKFPRCTTYAKLRDKLLEDLNNFIQCFEIYLAEFVNKVSVEKKFDMKSVYSDSNNIRIISFNYTNTFEKVILNSEVQLKEEEYHYIHGKANINNTSKKNNMVFGIGEYLKDEEKNTEVDFIAFKKYYQRIFKQTGNKYKKWLHSEPINVHIIGHSLDVTDKDILKELILGNNSKTTIYYYNNDDLGKKIANLVKVIGQEELIKRTGEDNIIFKNQEEICNIK